jgi:ketosteroid isomerase-like protein
MPAGGTQYADGVNEPDRLRPAYEAFFRGDLETTASMFHPDVVVHDAPELPDTGTIRGRDEAALRLRGFHELFEDLELSDASFEELGDRTLVVFTVRGRARAGGAPVEMTPAHLLRVEDGLVTEMRVFLSPAAARECAS